MAVPSERIVVTREGDSYENVEVTMKGWKGRRTFESTHCLLVDQGG
jgi:hypothetical protein